MEGYVKTTWNDITAKKTERRDIVWGQYHGLHGLSYTDCDCPFCGIDLEVYQWSSGGGKRCDGCGAMITPQGAHRVLVANEVEIEL